MVFTFRIAVLGYVATRMNTHLVPLIVKQAGLLWTIYLRRCRGGMPSMLQVDGVFARRRVP